MVILSWISFWIDYTCIPARATLPVASFLTLTSLEENIRKMVSTSNVNSDVLEIYLGVCNLFIYAVIIEYGMVGAVEHKMKMVRNVA